MATSHIDSNKETISDLNKAILTGNSTSCEDCNNILNPAAKSVKDQAISCNSCGKSFHKKCTNRKNQRGSNWQKNPWHCSYCLLGVSSRASNNVGNLEYNPSGELRRPPLQLEDDAIVDITEDTPELDVEPPARSQPSHLNPYVPVFVPLSLPVIQKPKFPSNAIRQKSSKIGTLDPEVEFLSTAVDACRSTIAQQEAELKRLKESLHVRDRTILQLQGQVDHAASVIGGRPDAARVADDASNENVGVENIIVRLISKIESLPMLNAHPVNSINIHNHGSDKTSVSSSSCSQTTQTEANVISCQNCQNKTNAARILNEHTEDHHEAVITGSHKVLNSVDDFTCPTCDKTFLSERNLNQHIEITHASVSSGRPCAFCNFKFPSISSLTEHIETSHNVSNQDFTQSSTAKVTNSQSENNVMRQNEKRPASVSSAPHLQSSGYSCARCKSEFVTTSNLEEHMETEHAITYIHCKLCEYKCETRNHLEKHISALHDQDSSALLSPCFNSSNL